MFLYVNTISWWNFIIFIAALVPRPLDRWRPKLASGNLWRPSSKHCEGLRLFWEILNASINIKQIVDVSLVAMILIKSHASIRSKVWEVSDRCWGRCWWQNDSSHTSPRFSSQIYGRIEGRFSCWVTVHAAAQWQWSLRNPNILEVKLDS